MAEDIDQLHFAHCTLDRDTLGVALCAREKMAQWRELLAEIYRAEIGALALPADGPGAADTL